MANENGSNKTSMIVIPCMSPARKTPKEKVYTRDSTRKRARSLKNASAYMELSALSESINALNVQGTQLTNINDNGHKGKKIDEETTAPQHSTSSKSKRSKKQQRLTAIPSQQTCKETSKLVNDTWLVESNDDEPLIKNFDYATFLDRHYDVISPGIHHIKYTYSELKTIMTAAIETLKSEPALVDVRAPIITVGDIHGQFNDLLNIFILLGKPPDQCYIFLGDYVDRGAMSLECMTMMLCYKILYPNHIHLLRGNHECGRVNKRYGFMDEIESSFPGQLGQRVWALFQRVFNELPVAGIIEKRILCMHGGLSPFSIDDIRNKEKPIRNPSKGVINDFLWSDPLNKILFWRTSVRGSGFCFGEQVVEEICEKHEFDLILRAHQLCMDGFWSFANRRMMTIFSAPAYCNVFRNAAAVLKIDKNLRCQLIAFVPDSPHARAMIESHKTLWEEPELQPSTVQSQQPTSFNMNNKKIERPLPTSCT